MRPCGPHFTFELSTGDEFQFLDVLLSFDQNYICRRYHPRSVKPLLHSKVVKNGIVLSCLRSVLVKSCRHDTTKRFHEQIKRLKTSGYTDCAVSFTCEKLIRWVKRKPPKKVNDDDKAKKKKSGVAVKTKKFPQSQQCI